MNYLPKNCLSFAINYSDLTLNQCGTQHLYDVDDVNDIHTILSTSRCVLGELCKHRGESMKYNIDTMLIRYCLYRNVYDVNNVMNVNRK